MFCVECGKDGEIYKNGVCINCYVKNKTFTRGPTVIDIFTCSSCSSYKYKNTWINETFDEIVKRNVKDNFQISNELKNISITNSCSDKKRIIDCKIIISGFINEYKIEEEHFLKIRIKTVVCDICSKQFGGYYEAILQIRADKKSFKNELNEIKVLVEYYVEEFRQKGNRGLFITDFSDESSGMDFFLSEKGPAYTIAKKIQEKFGGEIKQSSSNIGMKDSKQIYRMTYLVRLPSYKKGNFIAHNGKYFFIAQINGNKIHVIDMDNWNDIILEEKQLKNIKILGGLELLRDMIMVSQSKDEIQVMDTKDYHTFEIKKPKNIKFSSDMVKIVNLGDKFFLFPKSIT